MFKLLSQNFYCASNILKNFGIVNPNILRNLSYYVIYSVLANFMRLDWGINQQILSPETAASHPLEPWLLSPERELGT